jgi:putative transcriptional regulator
MRLPQSGDIIIAEPFLRDANYMRSVILICTQHKEGSLGFVLNKKLEYTLDELLTDMDGIKWPVYQGGPVQLDTIHYIHQYPELLPESLPIGEHAYWGGDYKIMLELLRNGEIHPDKIKFFLGYSGWDKGQLEAEFEENTWLTATSTRKLIFDTKPELLWKQTLLHMGGSYEEMINYPIDPQLN